MTSLAPEFIIQQSKSANKLIKKVDLQLSIHGLSFTEYMILHHLDEAQKNTLRRIELADLVGISASGVTRVLLPMEKIKLVQKEVNARDARVSLVKLSKTGQRVFNDAKISFSHICESLTENITAKQMDLMMGLTRQLGNTK